MVIFCIVLSLALLAANYGDNRLSVLLRMREQESCVHGCFGYPRDLVFGSRDMVYPYVPAGQEDWRLCNSFDYSNDYFRLMDTVPLRELIAHVEMLVGKRGGSAGWPCSWWIWINSSRSTTVMDTPAGIMCLWRRRKRCAAFFRTRQVWDGSAGTNLRCCTTAR